MPRISDIHDDAECIHPFEELQMNMGRRPVACAMAMLSLAAITAARAEVRLPRVIADNMVLQQRKPIHIWGWADEGERVTVRFHGRSATARARDGRWSVTLAPVTAGGPWTMTVTGKNRLSFREILVGEVWVCSGQSNMQLPLSLAANAKEAIAEAGDPALRLFSIPSVSRSVADHPNEDVADGSWSAATPSSVPDFSAVGYFFARALRRVLHVPVGVINASWGGTAVEAWTSVSTFEAEHVMNYVWHNAPNAPSALYNGMIAPLVPYVIRGVIWYQGESNAAEFADYRTRFPNMITDWRTAWGLGDFPFLLVQIAPFYEPNPQPEESYLAGMREAQALATRVLPRVGMAVITDVGDAKDIHPRRKQPVGERLALLARKLAYGEKIVAAGPAFRSMRVVGDRAILRFYNVGSGLEARGGKLTGFAIAGADRKFVWADAVIEGRAVVATSPAVPHPAIVRFGWASYPVVNLCNKEGLPAEPFRTDAPAE